MPSDAEVVRCTSLATIFADPCSGARGATCVSGADSHGTSIAAAHLQLIYPRQTSPTRWDNHGRVPNLFRLRRKNPPIVQIGENELSVDRQEFFKMRTPTQILAPRSVEILCDWQTPLQLQQTARAYSSVGLGPPTSRPHCLIASLPLRSIRNDESRTHARRGYQLPPRQ